MENGNKEIIKLAYQIRWPIKLYDEMSHAQGVTAVSVNKRNQKYIKQTVTQCTLHCSENNFKSTLK